MAPRYKSVEAAELVPLESFQSTPGAQSNITDPDSRIMKKSNHAEYTQSYNAQAVVDAEGSMMVLGCYVTNHATDRGELAEALNAVAAETGTVKTVLADAGYARSNGTRAAKGTLQEAKEHRRTGLWNHQTGLGLPAVFASWVRESQFRVAVGELCL